MIKYLCMTAFVLLTSISVRADDRSPISYVALGDSYTIGTGGPPAKSWPSLIADHLRGRGIPIVLVANLGREGWTARDLILYELPIFQKIHPDRVSLLIGVNDWVQGVDAAVFAQNLQYILDQIQAVIPNPAHIILVNIPDFSVMPSGSQYGFGRNIPAGIAAFNQIIQSEARLHHLNVVDLNTLSKTMKGDPSMAAADGLHPSAKGYALWADLIQKSFTK